MLLADVNWQLQNGLTYFTSRLRPAVVVARMTDVILYAPTLIRDNLAIGRDLVLTERAQAALAAAYGPLFSPVRDARAEPQRLRDLVAGLAPGTRYVLCVLKPSREFPLDGSDSKRTLAQLTGGRLQSIATDGYAAVAGLAGAQPALVTEAAAPFRARVRLNGVDVDVRMESWLDFDTIRRMGFGQVVAARHHSLIVERGVSFVAFDERGRPVRMGYAAGLFAPEARYVDSGESADASGARHSRDGRTPAPRAKVSYDASTDGRCRGDCALGDGGHDRRRDARPPRPRRKPPRNWRRRCKNATTPSATSRPTSSISIAAACSESS